MQPWFHCTTRDMLVAADLTDCYACPLRAGCAQFREKEREVARLRLLGLLGPNPLDLEPPVPLREPQRPRLEE